MTSATPTKTAAAIGLTVLVPGSGHALFRRWWDLASWALVAVVVIGGGWLAVGATTLGQLADTDTLRRALAVNIVLAVARLATLVDLVWTTRAFRTIVGAASAGVAIVAIVIPHVLAHRLGTDTIDVLEAVFVAPDGLDEAAVLAESVSRAPEPPTDGAAHPIEGISLEGFTLQEERQELAVGQDGRFTVLLLGTDEGPGRVGFRTDSIMVVSIDPWTLSTAMFGIPRNWGGVPMPDSWPGPPAHDDLANTIYQYGWEHPDLHPNASDPGAAVAMRVFGDLLDLEIDHFVKVSMLGFVEVVDAMGGVEMNVTFEVHNEFSLPGEAGYVRVDLAEGVQTLTGLEAMGYSRSRRTSNDYHRMGRQRCVIAAIAHQLEPVDLLMRFGDLSRAIGDHVSTDIPLTLVPAMIDVGALIDQRRIATVTFVPPHFVDGSDGSGRHKPHVERIRSAVREGLAPELSGTEGVVDVEAACEL